MPPPERLGFGFPDRRPKDDDTQILVASAPRHSNPVSCTPHRLQEGLPRMWLRCGVVAAAMLAVMTPARGHAIDLPDVLTGYAIASWADGDGRPLGSVNAIAQDLDGYLWIGTDTGLVRFDGWRFARWEMTGDAARSTSAVSTLFVS